PGPGPRRDPRRGTRGRRPLLLPGGAAHRRRRPGRAAAVAAREIRPGGGPLRRRRAVIPVLWSGGGLVAVDKPAGMPVIPGRSEEGGPPLRERLESQLGRRVWGGHPLDRGTPGVLLLPLHARAHRAARPALEPGAAGQRLPAPGLPPP